MGATPPPHPCGRTESYTLRILTDAFTGAHKKKSEKERQGCEGYGERSVPVVWCLSGLRLAGVKDAPPISPPPVASWAADG